MTFRHALLASLGLVVAARNGNAQDWHTLGVFTAYGSSPSVYSVATPKGTIINFALASDCVFCPDVSTECGRSTSALVQYAETTNGDSSSEGIALHFGYAGGPSSAHWKDVSVSGMTPCFDSSTFGCQWGVQGISPCVGCDFKFAVHQDPVYIGTGAPGGDILVSGALSASDPNQLMTFALSGAPPASYTFLYFQYEELAVPSYFYFHNPLYALILEGPWVLGFLFLSSVPFPSIALPPLFKATATSLTGSATCVGGIPPSSPIPAGAQFRFQWATFELGVPPTLKLSSGVRVTVDC